MIKTEHLACNAILLVVQPINAAQEAGVVYRNAGPLEAPPGLEPPNNLQS